MKKTALSDASGVFDLYKKVTSIEGKLARLRSEIDHLYISGFIEKSLNQGLSLVATDIKQQIVGEIHAYSSGLSCFSHVLTELTIAVDPNKQGLGVGRKLFEGFLQEVNENFKHILRVELIALESNQKAIQFYQTLGFQKEGLLQNRIKNSDGNYESDITMAWFRSKTSKK
ncbi:MAG: N-acetyltransferase family protein [Marinicellaceae bacterium]